MHAFSTLDAAAAWKCKYCWSSLEQARSMESTSTRSKFGVRKSDLQVQLSTSLRAFAIESGVHSVTT
jgi:hypothetical protein